MKGGVVSAGTGSVSEIARYIAKDNPDAAERWVNELFDAVGAWWIFRERPRSFRRSASGGSER